MDEAALRERRWRNRRKMAWCALFGGLFYPLLMLVPDAKHIGELAFPFYLFTGSVVGAYVGFSTFDDKWQDTLKR